MDLQILVQHQNPLATSVSTTACATHMKTLPDASSMSLQDTSVLLCTTSCSAGDQQPTDRRNSRSSTNNTPLFLFLSSLRLSLSHCIAHSTPASSFTLLSFILLVPSFPPSFMLSLTWSLLLLADLPLHPLFPKYTAEAVLRCSPVNGKQ